MEEVLIELLKNNLDFEEKCTERIKKGRVVLDETGY